LVTIWSLLMRTKCDSPEQVSARKFPHRLRPAWHTVCLLSRCAHPAARRNRWSAQSETERPSRSRLSQITSCHLASLDLARTSGEYTRVNILSPKLTETGGLRWSNAEFKSRRTICFPVETSSSRLVSRIEITTLVITSLGEIYVRCVTERARVLSIAGRPNPEGTITSILRGFMHRA